MKNGRKMIAPIVITVLVILYFIAYAALILWLQPPRIVIILGIVLFVILSVILIAMLRERIHEIRSGEEDDLGKY